MTSANTVLHLLLSLHLSVVAEVALLVGALAIEEVLAELELIEQTIESVFRHVNGVIES